jgi:hypothetical protein
MLMTVCGIYVVVGDRVGVSQELIAKSKSRTPDDEMTSQK